jgi:23S rRNA A1618 N6-methylase RlmF
MLQKSILNSFKQDEAKVALRWVKFQEFISKVEYIKIQKEEKYQDGFLRDIFENCLGYTLDMTNPSNYNLEKKKKNETDSKKSDLMFELNKKLQETKQNFYDELKLEKLTTKLQKFEELEFDDFIKEYTKSKKIKFADKLEERNFKNAWIALFENDKKEVLEIQNQINITDKEIDTMVYKLYDLTEDEIKIVEGV